MSIQLPEPVEGDVWGAELNAAIEEVAAEAEAASAAAATNVRITDTDQDGNPIIDYGNTSATVLLASAVGSSVAVLDGAGQVPKTELGNLSFTDVGAASAAHSHPLADVPQAALAINTSPVFTTFNTVTQQWQRRADITSSPSRTVIYVGDAEVPSDAIAGVDFHLFPKSSGATIPNASTTPDPVPTPDPVTGISMSIPVVTVNGSLYNITATFTNGPTARTFTYLQLAVRGPNGEQQDTGYRNNISLTAGQAVTLTGSGNAGSVGTWSTNIAYNATGATTPGSWVNGPAQTFSVASTGGGAGGPGTGVPGSGSVPLIGRSGLTWNSGVYDYSDGSVDTANQMFAWRGRPGDHIMYFTGRSTWADLTWLRDDLTAWPGFRVVSLSSQPSNMDNSSTAAGTNNAFWVQYGLNLKNKGWDDGRTIIRLNWEANGNWYPWSWVFGGASVYVNAFKNVVNSIKTNAPKTKFILGMNRGSVNGGIDWKTQIADPLIGFVDIIGLDWYDRAPGQPNQTAFDAASNADPGGNTIATYCRAKGLSMSIDEWGSCETVNGVNAGGDNPFYIGAMFTWMQANNDIFRLDSYFNNSAGDGLAQQIYPTTVHPNSAASYKAANHWGV